jgi:PilZ domain
MNIEPLAGTPADKERRQSQRRKFRGKIEIEWGSTTLTGTVRDISPQGLFVELMPPLWVGASFSARVILNPVLQLVCTVRRVEPGKGIGVEFQISEGSEKARLNDILADLPPL